MTTELLKLRTIRSVRWLVVGAVVVAAFLGAAGAAVAGNEGTADLGTAGMLADLVEVSTLPAFVALLLGIVGSAGEFQHRTITQTLLATPDRRRVVSAKTLAVAIVGPVAALVMAATALAAAVPALATGDVRVHLFDAELATSVGRSVLAAALLGIVGVGLGLLLRSQVAAVVAVLGWLFVVEGVLGNVVGQEVRRWGPTSTPGQLAVGAVVLTAATMATARRDVT